MKLRLRPGHPCGGNPWGFTLAEVMVAVAVLTIMVLTAFTGITMGWSVMHSARDDLRATQILTQKLESIRLLNWDQIAQCPTNFVDQYNPNASDGSGTVYNGIIAISTPTNFNGLSYQGQVKLVTVTVTWKSYFGIQSVTHSRAMQTYSAMNGMQNYIWGSHL